MGPSNGLSCETGSFSPCCNDHRFLQPEVLRLYFSHAETLGCTVYVPSQFSSEFIHTHMWGHPVHQTPPCPTSSSSHHLVTSPLCPSGHLRPSYRSGWMFLLYSVVVRQFNFLEVLVVFVFKFVVVLLLVVRGSYSASTYASILAWSLEHKFLKSRDFFLSCFCWICSAWTFRSLKPVHGINGWY